MKLELSLSQRPEMQLRLSPQLIQRIEILQLPAQELVELIQQECAENETIEVEPPRSEAPAPANGSESESGETELAEQVSSNLEKYTGYSEILRPRVRRDGERDAKMEAMLNAPSAPGTLQDHLLAQVAFANLAERTRACVEILVMHLDENGFLPDPLEELIIPYDERYTLEEFRQAHEYLRILDPVGVGARDMRECFLAQLDPGHPRHDLLRRIIGEHLDDWRDNRLPKIARALALDMERLKDALDELRGLLVPPPGRLFRQEVVVPVRPDIVVERGDGGYEVRLEDDYYPQVTLSPSYVDLYRDRSLGRRMRRDLRNKIERARFLIEAIEQRKNTLHRVALVIVEHQREFFEDGSLLPLKMRDVADTLGLHVSTVSRAISDKWMQTPRGIFPMKHFFTGAAPGGQAVGLESRDSVRTKVQEIIDAEDKRRPLSDEDVVEKLAACGLDIARRTVTKYRKMLNIPSSRQRREY
ncbi:MAG: RNA polymerase factor sigma-54 [Planctomycetes bacterium]|nr:RNA polymerase factor sigma-54 [Planctomycetota bacterium]